MRIGLPNSSRKLGAKWFFDKLWDRYLSLFDKPYYSAQGYLLIGLSVVHVDILLEDLRKLYAQHISNLRRYTLVEREAKQYHFFIKKGNTLPPTERHLYFKSICNLRKIISQSCPEEDIQNNLMQLLAKY